jgi:threonine dehydrogenase-like Zn-dependent dehydrogenase
MRALVFDDKLQFVPDISLPELTGAQWLLKIRRAGICNTDLELIDGMYNFSGILGHEFVAEVVEGAPEWVGKPVVGEINVGCGECDFCQKGIPSQCRDRKAVGIHTHPGAFADYLALTERNLHAVPPNIADDAAVFTEPLAAALEVLESTHISPQQRIIVVGVGKLGALVTQVLKLSGAGVIGLVRREKQAQLLDNWGIASAAYEELPKQRAQVVVDCTGTAEGFAIALDLVEARGTIVLKSTYKGKPQADLTQVAVREIRVVGSRCGSFDGALRLLAAGLIDTQSLVDAHYPIEQGLEAFQAAKQPGAMKVLLDF